MWFIDANLEKSWQDTSFSFKLKLSLPFTPYYQNMIVDLSALIFGLDPRPTCVQNRLRH